MSLSLRVKSWGARPLSLVARAAPPVILRYHRVIPDGADPFYNIGIPTGVFDKHLDWLAENRNLVSLDQMVSWVEGKDSLPPKAVALTFDDGYKDNLVHALPILRRYHAPAIIYLVSHLIDSRRTPWWDALAHMFENTRVGSTRLPLDLDSIGDAAVTDLSTLSSRRLAFGRACEALKMVPDAKRRAGIERVADCLGVEEPDAAQCPLLSWDDARVMVDAGVEIGSHTCSHPIMTRLSRQEAWKELMDSKSLIEDRLGTPVRHFSFPNGKRDDFSVELSGIVRAAGYGSAVTTIEGALTQDEDIFSLSRKGVTEGTVLNSNGEFSAELLQVELSGLFDALFLRRWRDRRIH